MNKILGPLAFLLGLAVVAWIGAGYVGTNGLALGMTVLIAVVYVVGGVELLHFHRATGGLRAALLGLTETVPTLGPWLDRLHPSLQNPVRLRIDGERSGLPGPAMTPYLVGLLVMLGMLGTFLGMVVTLKGAVLALESTTDLAGIRAALAAPVAGLGLAFGTSVAGVAASAMLGLVSALCRRDRQLGVQLLDSRIATHLRRHTQAHQREAMLEALQQQSRALPELIERMSALAEQQERQQLALNERLLAGQDRFYAHAQTAYVDLAQSVDRSLKQSLVDSVRAAGAGIPPMVEAALAGLARESAQLQQGLAATVRQTLAGVVDGHAQQSAALVATIEQAHARLLADAAAGDQQRLAGWSEGLTAMSATLRQHWAEAGASAVEQQAQICQTLAQTAREMQVRADDHARATVAEVSRLIETASDAPRAAAEVVGLMRGQLSDSLARDQALLAERAGLIESLGHLLDTVRHSATAQSAAIDGLVARSADLLAQAESRFGARLEAESSRMASTAAQLGGSAVEVASLGEAFGTAVQLFSQSSEALSAQLVRIEAALDKASTRSDEQLAYYVAQAREIIDLSISSQQQIVEDLQQLAPRQAPADLAA